MNYGKLFSYFFAIFLLGQVSLNYGYPTSCYVWQLPNQKHILVVGDVHEKTDAEIENIECFKKTIINFNDNNTFLTCILECNENRVLNLHYTGVDLLNKFNKWVDLNKNQYKNIFFKLSDIRGPRITNFFKMLIEFCNMELDIDPLFKHTIDENQIQRTKTEIKEAAFIKQPFVNELTKKDLFDEFMFAIKKLKEQQKDIQVKKYGQLMCSVEESFNVLHSIFARCKDDTLIFDFLFELLLEFAPHKSLELVFAESISQLMFKSLPDAGFIADLLKSIEKKQNIMMYVGNAHAMMVNQLIEQELHGKAIMKFEGESLVDVELAIDDLNNCCTEFQKRCFNDHKRKAEDHEEQVDNKKQKVDRTFRFQSSDGEIIEVPELIAMLSPTLKECIECGRHSDPSFENPMPLNLTCTEFYNVFAHLNKAINAFGYDQVQKDLSEEEINQETLAQWRNIFKEDSLQDASNVFSFLGLKLLHMIAQSTTLHLSDY